MDKSIFGTSATKTLDAALLLAYSTEHSLESSSWLAKSACRNSGRDDSTLLSESKAISFFFPIPTQRFSL